MHARSSEVVASARPEGARDALTGLADRALFRRRLAAAASTGRGLTLLFLDLDNFKNVNDGYGHAVGDALLAEIGRRLEGVVRADDTVGRLGGDEFAVVCPGVSSEAWVQALAERVREVLRAPVAVNGRTLHVTASIGCRALSAGPAPEPDSLLGDADAAMYEARAGGRDRVALFAAETRARLVRRLDLAGELRGALDRDELMLHLQPHVELATGRIVGAEALLRWRHPELGDVSPGEFIPVAERFGLIGPIGTWVLRRAATLLAQWQAAGRALMLSVNVSAAQLIAGGFAELVEEIVGAAGIVPSSLCLEITESTLMGTTGGAIDALRRLRDRGHYVAIDDFGTGYSSLVRLKELPVEILKIDRGFVGGLGGDTHDTAIVASIMSLAHAMGLHVIAEGIETPEQVSDLRALGCSVGQGFLFARPAPPRRFDLVCENGIGPIAPAERRLRRRGFVDEFMHQIGIPDEAL